jgi:hypothetical protein
MASVRRFAREEAALKEFHASLTSSHFFKIWRLNLKRNEVLKVL